MYFTKSIVGATSSVLKSSSIATTSTATANTIVASFYTISHTIAMLTIVQCKKISATPRLVVLTIKDNVYPQSAVVFDVLMAHSL